MQFDSIKHRQSFLNVISIKSRSTKTVSNYVGHLDRFFARFNHNIPKATTEQLSEYILSCGSASSMAQVHTTLNYFYTYVLKQPRKVAKFIPYPDKTNYFPVVPTHEQMIKVIEETKNIKHRLILRILYSTGIRVGELIQLKWCDIQRVKGINPLSLRITGKGGKFRIVPLSDETLNLLLEYCKEYNLKCDSKTHYVFGASKPYSARSVQNVVREAGLIIGFDSLSPHDLRRAFAREQRKNNLDLLRLQELLGHASISTTRKYAGVENLEVKLLL